MYKTLHGLASAYIAELLSPNHPDHLIKAFYLFPIPILNPEVTMLLQ